MLSARDLVTSLAAAGTSRPTLTWYGTGGERVELSGRVLANWVVKAANLLVEEADAGPRRRVSLDLPVHWRTLVWALGAWTAGAAVTLRPDTSADVVVTTRPQEMAGSGGALVVAVALPALALRFPAGLPPGAIDGAADLMTYPDVLGWVPALVPDAPALDGGPTHAALLDWAHAAAGAAARRSGVRALLLANRGAEQVLAEALTAWAVGGSMVLVGDERLDVAAIAAAERAVLTSG